jgi:hypothetical protein
VSQPSIPIRFFDRPRDYQCLAASSWHSFWLWLVPLFFLTLGYLINGERFFTWQYWREPHGIRYHPLIGIPFFVALLCWGAFVSLDNLLAHPCRVGVLGPYLLINRRKTIALSDLDLKAANLNDHPRVVSIPYVDASKSALSLPMFTKTRATALVGAIHEFSRLNSLID